MPDYKLELHNFAVDGRVMSIRLEESGASDLVKERKLKFKYFNAKLRCYADVSIIGDINGDKDSLWKLAVTFVKRLK